MQLKIGNYILPVDSQRIQIAYKVFIFEIKR